jgi:hypothetical protein
MHTEIKCILLFWALQLSLTFRIQNLIFNFAYSQFEFMVFRLPYIEVIEIIAKIPSLCPVIFKVTFAE